MSDTPTPLSTEEVSIEQLIPGMYVIAIAYNNSQVKMKSEGYIKNKASVDKLKSAGIQRVVVDPSKDKNARPPETEQVESVPENTSAAANNDEPKIHIDKEINKANQLFNNAKDIKIKVIESLKSNKNLDVKTVEDNTNAMVDSIFRNQDALSCMSQLKDKSNYLVDHALNCAILMAIFAKKLQLDETIIKEITLGAFLHDIGKVFLDNKILNKKTHHSDEELEKITKHVGLGAKVLEDSPSISNIAMTILREHHERLDGSGYPKGLKADEISKYGKMMAIVDSYDVMTTDRPGNIRIFPIQAFKILSAEAGEIYDEDLVNEFIQALGVYPVGTLVKLTSGKLGLISQLNRKHPLTPFVRVFYNTRMNQAIAIKEIDLSKPRNNDQIECCIKPEEFNLNLLGFFKEAFLN